MVIQIITNQRTRTAVKSMILLSFSGCLSFAVMAQDIYVSSRNTHSVKLFDFTGNYVSDIVSPGSGGLSFPQEVLYHAPSTSLLVTGRGNGYIKQYDSATGDYLGNFTSGYVLDNPTKTTIWKDSLIYVSQWGATQNKVARFDFATGAYLDEFTSIGIANAGGHAWDSLGNLYVAKYGSGTNGEILKFDPAGDFLGVFIPTGVLLGPVNIWFDDNNVFYVEDWTHGKVFKFNGSTGAYLSTMVSGLTNAEGFAFDVTGNLYLCDWTAGIIYKYDTSGALIPFITTGDLMAPNSILLHLSPVSSVGEPVLETGVEAEVFPTPFNTAVSIRISVLNPSAFNLAIVDLNGKKIKTICADQQLAAGDYTFSWDGKAENGSEAVNGVYFLEIQSSTNKHTIKLLKN